MTPLQVLSRYPLFSLMPTELRLAWLTGGQRIQLTAGEVLFQENTPGNWAYVLMSGRVRILRRTPSGREVSLGTVGPGELLGEYALLAPGQNTATCRAAVPTVLWQLPLGPIREWIGRQPAIAPQLKNWLRLHFLLRHLRGQSALGFPSGPSALAMLPHLQTVSVAPQRAVQTEGLCSELWFYLEQGEVLLEGTEPSSVLQPGDTLGEAALTGNARLPTAVALTEVHLQALPREYFLRPEQRAGASQDQSLSAQYLEPPEQVHWVGQREATDCGAASLAMVARYHRMPQGIAEIRTRLHLGPRGATLGELVRVAEEMGFDAQAVRVGPMQLPYVRVPAVVHLIHDHYVVLFRLTENLAMLGDPARGVVTISPLHLAEVATGHLLLLRPRSDSRLISVSEP